MSHRIFMSVRPTVSKIWLSDMTVTVNFGFPAHELSGIIRHLEAHRNDVLEAWHDYFGD